MTRDAREGAEGFPHHISEQELAWAGEHMTQLRESVSGQRIVLWSLGIGFVLGLAAYVGGYALKASVTTEPLKLAADLLYALGWALWTGVVVALFVEVIPRAKQRQIKRALDAYEAALHEKARSRHAQASDQTSRGDT
jgi:predicted lysophospholipase L1 biosynthesis ABC-type transport system permease subunit